MSTRDATQEPLDTSSVLLRTADTKIVIPYSNEFRVCAIKWSKVVRNRVRWNKFDEQEIKHGETIKNELLRLSNTSKETFDSFARSEIVSVEIPSSDFLEKLYFNRFPWEYCLSAATKKIRTVKRLTVIRSLVSECRGLHEQKINRILYIEIIPMDTERKISFETERMLVREHLGIGAERTNSPTWHFDDSLRNPSIEALKNRIVQNPPDVIHIAGISTTAARHIFNIETPLPNGLMPPTSINSKDVIEYTELARILCSAENRKPVLIFANLNRTSTQFSVECLRQGAGAVLSISNSIDSSILYKFMANFYRKWKYNNFNSLLDAFNIAYRDLVGGTGDLRGTALVLNSARPLIDHPDWPGATESVKSATNEKPTSIDTIDAARKAIKVMVIPEDELNYATLHNAPKEQGCLFREFNITNNTNTNVQGVHVEVELHFGSERFPYRQSFVVDAKDTRPIKKLVQVPLTSALIREIRESVKTSLYVKVAYQNYVVYEHTFDVLLLPANEWHDSRRDGIWLPSFILPRDPVVEEIVQKSTRYLKAMLDNPAACFSGYLLPISDNISPKNYVEKQVSAIWCTLLYDYSLEYISPPPTYTSRSQRLRTPTQVIRSKSGTCIDLVLLFAACLEHIDIHACVVIQRGHAQLAYWCDESSYSQFASGLDPMPDNDALLHDESKITEQVSSDDEDQIACWVMTNPAVLLELLKHGAISIVEMIDLTEKKGFKKSKITSRYWNKNKLHAFRALVDVQLARKSQITPLPLIESI